MWYILGSFILIGPFVAMHKMISGLNALCSNYNAAGFGNGATVQVNINT